MNLRRIALAAAAVGSSLSVYAEVGITPDEIKWQRNPATGSEIAVLWGDPSKPVPFVQRVKYGSGFKAMPHSHPVDVQVTVLSGTLYWAEGESFDESKLKAYPAGSFLLERANVPHYQTAKGDVVFQAAGTGPNGFKFVNPKDDPRSK